MGGLLAVGAALAALAPAAAGSAPRGANSGALAPCERLATYARSVKPSAWAQGEKALAPALQIEQQTSISDADKPPGAAWRPLTASLAMIRKAIDDEDGLVWAERLAGTDVYLAFTVQGTLECQNAVFLKAGRGGAARVIPGPKSGADGDAELCWTRSGDFGRVFGRPAYIAHGPVTAPNPDDEIDITPWTGAGWAPTCKVSLRFHTDQQVAERYCGDPAVCRAAGAIARDVAVRYNRATDAKGFAYGAPPSSAAKAAVARVRAKMSDTDTPDFPTFGKSSDEHPFSYSNFVLFPLTLGGRAYVAGIGHEGVGWRESDQTLFAVYEAKGTELVPRAGFVIAQSVTGLASAAAGPVATKPAGGRK